MKKLVFVALLVLSGLSQAGEFAIKGIKFGMSMPEVVAITGAVDYGSYPDKKPCSRHVCAFRGFSIGGVLGWNWPVKVVGGKIEYSPLLDMMFTAPKAENMEDSLLVFSEAYGKPTNFNRFQSTTKGGITLDNFTAVWFVKDAVITMTKHTNRDNGHIGIETIEHYNTTQTQHRTNVENAKKDF